jgi:hypothetical protein
MSENVKGQQPDNNNRPLSENDELQSTETRENVASNEGGVADLNDASITGGRSSATTQGSGISTKNVVTGSDYDGQVSQ